MFLAYQARFAGFNLLLRRRSAIFAAPVALVVFMFLSFADPALAQQQGRAPQRVMSLNLCTDQLLMLVAPRGRIASISYLAANSSVSAIATEAAGHHLNHGFAEDVVRIGPDLVLTGVFSTKATTHLLKRLGYRVLTLPAARTVEDVIGNLRTVAAALGEVDRGEHLIAAFRDEIVPTQLADQGPVAALYLAGGQTAGRDTLPNEILRAAGLRNLAGIAGWQEGRRLPLEILVLSVADLLVGGSAPRVPALAYESWYHPALRQVFAKASRTRIPDRFRLCGTPLMVEAVALLRTARDRLSER